MLDKLRIISSEQIMAFESTSFERTIKRAEDIERSGKLKNPLLVNPIGDRYLLLDDTSILTALQRLKIAHIPVQLTDCRTMSVHPWQRLAEEWHKDDMLEFCRAFPRQLSLVDSPSGPMVSDQAEVRFKDGSVFRLKFTSNSPSTRADMCIKLLSRIDKSFRAKLDHGDKNPLTDFPQASAAIYPPAFSLEELIDLAQNRILLPQGLVRIDQPGRILGIDYSLSILSEPVPIEDKESFLKELIRMRMVSDRVGYYNGHVLVFNN